MLSLVSVMALIALGQNCDIGTHPQYTDLDSHSIRDPHLSAIRIAFYPPNYRKDLLKSLSQTLSSLVVINPLKSPLRLPNITDCG